MNSPVAVSHHAGIISSDAHLSRADAPRAAVARPPTGPGSGRGSRQSAPQLDSERPRRNMDAARARRLAALAAPARGVRQASGPVGSGSPVLPPGGRSRAGLGPTRPASHPSITAPPSGQLQAPSSAHPPALPGPPIHTSRAPCSPLDPRPLPLWRRPAKAVRAPGPRAPHRAGSRRHHSRHQRRPSTKWNPRHQVHWSAKP